MTLESASRELEGDHASVRQVGVMERKGNLVRIHHHNFVSSPCWDTLRVREGIWSLLRVSVEDRITKLCIQKELHF